MSEQQCVQVVVDGLVNLQAFTDGRSWVVDDDGQLSILNENGGVIAQVADRRWTLVCLAQVTL